MDAPTQDGLRKELVRELKALRAEADRSLRTNRMKRVASLSVALREFFEAPDGGPDWIGRSGHYRTYISEAYRDAGYGRDEAKSVQNAIRFHASSVLRDRLTADNIIELGLQHDGPTERMRGYRKRQSETLAAVANLPSDPDLSRALAAAYLILNRVDGDKIAKLPPAERERLGSLLDRIAACVQELRAAQRGVSAGE